MTMRIRSCILVAALAVAGCGQSGAPGKQDTASGQNAAQSAAPASNLATETLTAKGISPGLDFGMRQAPAVAAAIKAFGAPTGREHNGECGQGPMDLLNFHDLSLEFDSGRLVGWSLSGAKPALRTAGGLAIGAPASVLGGAPIDHDSSLGLEFEVGGVGGLVDDQETRITALWAGSVCQFG
jgi:hypothetical protein